MRDPAVDRSLRSVFGEGRRGWALGWPGRCGGWAPGLRGSVSVSLSAVGNIPYEATEEQLKDIFSEVGPVVSFR